MHLSKPTSDYSTTITADIVEGREGQSAYVSVLVRVPRSRAYSFRMENMHCNTVLATKVLLLNKVNYIILVISVCSRVRQTKFWRRRLPG